MPQRYAAKAPVVAGVGFGVAAGVVFGALGVGPVLAGDDTAEIREQHRRTVQDMHTLESQVSTADDVVGSLSEEIVDQTLTQRPVLVLTTATASDFDVKAVVKSLDAAGRVDAGTIKLNKPLFEQDRQSDVQAVLQKSVPDKLRLPGKDKPAGQAAGTALAQAFFLDAQSTQPLMTDKQRAELLQALREKDFITYEDGSILPAQAVVIVDGKSSGVGFTEFSAPAMAQFAATLHSTGKNVVLAARIESAGAEGTIGRLREEHPEVSTVDSIDRGWARMAVPLAVREQLDGGAGAYGAAASASSGLPPRPEPATVPEVSYYAPYAGYGAY
ncbi:copper transporter [Corynebacterium lizhenjunii]|uniref:Copper transporter n=2 Tax=Corynebacterium lizhenjunii TaxID=2709394 RepID=A0A7T0KGH3_9CORY|nr:copper transporter [Corynebacterium lizhenjunii]QPK80144.1 copper transporter [Corynebacterium lizhenjunii]